MNEEKGRRGQLRKSLAKWSLKLKSSVKVTSNSAIRSHKYAVIQKARQKQKRLLHLLLKTDKIHRKIRMNSPTWMRFL